MCNCQPTSDLLAIAQIKVRYQPTCGTYVEQALRGSACKSLYMPNPLQA